MNSLRAAATDLKAMVLDTVRLWWRLLPQLASVFLAGWAGYQISLWGAVILGNKMPWIALFIFALGFVCTLGAMVVMLRMVGRELGIKNMIPEDEVEDDDRDASVSRLLALTLLPFLGIYAAFGYVSERATELTTYSMFYNGVLGDNLLGKINPLASTKQAIIAISVVVGAYLVRRLLDFVHDRTGWRLLGVAVAAVEAFFLLCFILAGQKALSAALIWITDRAFWGWLIDVRSALAATFERFRIDLPEVLRALGTWWREQIWPLFLDVMTEPIAWLAVAALVFGSHVLSVAELWRKGQPLATKVPGANQLTRLQHVNARKRRQGSNRGQRIWLEFQEAFLGDIDDKYLPTLQSLRLVLRAGLTFLGVYVLIYGMWRALGRVLDGVLSLLIGGHESGFWLVVGTGTNLAEDLLLETVRAVLLAVAFHRCLQLFRVKAAPQDLPAPRQSGPVEGRRVAAPVGAPDSTSQQPPDPQQPSGGTE